MKEIESITDLDPSDCVIKWRMTEMCNIRCSYCLRNCSKDKGREIDKDLLAEQDTMLLEAAGKIKSLLERSSFKNVKTDFIGGEVSLLNIGGIIRRLACRSLKRIHMTTNLTAPAEKYMEWAETADSLGIELMVTASLHYEFNPFDSYFKKIEALQSHIKSLACEIVSTKDNQPLVAKFIGKCESIGADYLVDMDSRENVEAGGLLHTAKRRSPRFLVKFTDGTEKEYLSTRELLAENSAEETGCRRYIRSKGFLCTNSVDYLYIEKNTVIGRKKGSLKCTNRIPVDEFSFLKNPEPCTTDYCSLCGHSSLKRL